MRLARNERCGNLLERLVEWLVVQEHPIIIVVPVKTIFYLPDRTSNLPNIGIPGESDERSIDTLPWRGRRKFAKARGRIR